jgi:Glu-tRNA(Gln) amidotransferase subunit E-like FAD-binding protein
VVVVWGPEEDCRTAADEIRLRYVDAVNGVPNETRQPFKDGTTDFERILPGPDRMYPDTDSPPTRVTRARVEGLKRNLAEEPWLREAKYSRAGVPRSTIYYLIRRSGAQIVDRVVSECGADLRHACFFFGERLVGLRRQGVPVDQVPAERWCELFHTFAAQPVLREAWEALVRRMLQAPDCSLARIVRELGLDGPPPAWRATIGTRVEQAACAAYRRDPGLMQRLAMGGLMRDLRGRVAAAEAAAALREWMEAPA